MTTKKTAVYPVALENIAIARTLHQFFSEIQFEYVTVSGTGLVDKDLGCADNHSKTGMRLKSDLDKALSNSDSLLILPGTEKDTIHYQSLDAIGKALANRKNIYCMLTLQEDDYHHFCEVARRQCVDFMYFGTHTESRIPLEIHDSFFFESRIPVILVGGLIEEADVLEVLLNIILAANKQGFRTLAFSTSSYLKFLGYHNYPQYNPDYSIAENITYFNRYLEHCVKKEKPNLIILHAPDSILRFSGRYPNGYGILTYMLTQAIRPDYIIGCVQFFTGNLDVFLESISRDLELRLGGTLDYVHLSNVVVDKNNLVETNKMACVHVPHQEVRHFLKRLESKIPVYNLLDPKDLSAMSTSLFANLKTE